MEILADEEDEEKMVYKIKSPNKRPLPVPGGFWNH